MIGNLRPFSLNNEYKEIYCSLCSSLRKRSGLKGSFLLNFDMTYMILGLSHLLPDAHKGHTRCPAKYFKVKRPILKHEVIDLAAQYIFVLGWIKSIDILVDRDYRNNPAQFMFFHSASKWLALKSKKVINGSSPQMIKIIEHYIQLIRNDNKDFKQIRKITNHLAAQICQELLNHLDCSEEFKQCYTRICGYSGELVAIFDPILDINDDINSGKYNPILFEAQQNKVSIFSAFRDYFAEYSILEKKLLSEVEINGHLLNAPFINQCKETLSYNNKKIQKTSKIIFKELFFSKNQTEVFQKTIPPF